MIHKSGFTIMVFICIMIFAGCSSNAATEKETYNEILSNREIVDVYITFERVSEKLSEDVPYNAIKYFDKPILKGKRNSVAAINDVFEKQVEDFFNGTTQSIHFSKDISMEFFDMAQDWGALKAGYNNEKLFYKVNTSIEFMDKDILSVRETIDWYCGGSGYQERYGIVFDLHTGEVLTPKHFLSMGIDDFNRVIYSKLCDVLLIYKEEMKEELWAELEQYTFEDYIFYYDGICIYLIFQNLNGHYGSKGWCEIPYYPEGFNAL